MNDDFSAKTIDLARQGDFALGDLAVRPSVRQVGVGESFETLEPRIMQVLVALAGRRGEVVSRDDLIELCWGGLAVSDGALHRCISRLRKLGEASGAFSLETIAKVGYRMRAAFNAPPKPQDEAPVGRPEDKPSKPAAAAPPQTRLVERRQVTVLNCALVDADDARRDPEDWRAVVVAFQEEAARIVAQFGGHAQLAQGDAFTALFGDEQAGEDDAQRAVRAGLAIADVISARGQTAPVSVGIGIDTGPIVVASSTEASYGAALTLAARLQGQADANRVIISPATASLAGGYFHLESLAGRAFRVAGALANRTRFDISRARGLSQFVGRSGDLRLLEEALTNAESGQGQVIGVVAEAGAGKSRLCFEFLEQCRARGFQVFEGRAVAHGRNIPFLPILDVFRAFFDIAQKDGDATARTKIETSLLKLDAKLAHAAPLLFEFLGVADPARPSPTLDPEIRQRQLIGLMRHMIKLAGAERPTVTMIEDLHWLDPASAQFIEHMVGGRADTSNLLLFNFRPEFRADWMQNSWYRQIPLAPLGREALGELIEDLLGEDASLAALTEPMQARTAGNPFFVEEIVQTLIETGQLEGGRGAYRLATPVAKLDVPPTVKAVLAARIDRLNEREKQLMQTASVIGKDFAEPLLAAVANLSASDLTAALAALRRAEFINEQSLFPVAEYAFRHPLTQEVALVSLLKDRRRLIHAAVARAIEAQDADHLDERAALLAHHWEEAGENVAAARWHSRAAEWAGFTNAAEALRHWQSARRLLRSAPQTAETIPLGVAACMGALGLSWRLGSPKAQITEVFEEGMRLAEASADITAQAMMNGIYGCFLGLVEGKSDDYCHYSREAIRLAEQTADLGLQISQRSFLGFGAVSAGRLEEGLASFEWALANLPNDPELGRQLSGFSPYLGLLQTHAWMLAQSGRLGEARVGTAKAEALAAEFGDFEVHTSVQLPNLELAIACADAEAAREHANTALSFSERSGTPQSRMIGLATHGAACRLEARWDEAVAASTEAVQRATSGANANMEGWVRAELAMALLGRGDIDEAAQQAQLAADVALSRNSRCDEVRALVALMHAQIANGGGPALARADEALERAKSLVEDYALNLYLPDLHECRGRTTLKRSNAAEGLHDIRTAEQLCRDMGAPRRADRLKAEFST
jgi:adenylate cyclase